MQHTVRYFTHAIVNSEIDTVEIPETQFQDIDGEITYERHTRFANGVDQICLTKLDAQEIPYVEDIDIISG